MISARMIGKGLFLAGAFFVLGCVLPVPGQADVLKPPPKPASSLIPKKSSDTVPLVPLSRTYDRDYVGEMQVYTAKFEDTMLQIARTFDVGFVELRAANPYLDPWMPGAGKKVIIPSMHLLPRAPHTGIVVNLAEMRLYAFLKPGQVKTFPLGIGAEGLATPTGTTSIVRKVVGPTWRPTPRMRRVHPELPAVVGPGPDNPMGTNAMYLGWPQYAIHGTDKPFSIGRRASSGCMRMYPENITTLYGMTPVGTTVTVVNQPVKLGWIGDKLYMEAHPTTAQADKMELDGGLPGYVFTEEDMGAIIAAAGTYARDLNWPLIRQIVRERRGYPVEIFNKQKTQAAVKPVPTPVAFTPEKPAANPAEEKKGQDKKEQGKKSEDKKEKAGKKKLKSTARKTDSGSRSAEKSVPAVRTVVDTPN